MASGATGLMNKKVSKWENQEEAVFLIRSNGAFSCENLSAKKFIRQHFPGAKTIRDIFQQAQQSNGHPLHPLQLPHVICARSGERTAPVTAGLLTSSNKRIWIKATAYPDPVTSLLEKGSVMLELKDLEEDRKPVLDTDFHFSLQSMLDNIDEGYVILDLEFRLVYFNQQAAVIGKSVSDKDPVSGATFFDFVKPELKEALLEIFEKALNGIPSTIINKYTLNQSRIIFEVIFSPFFEGEKVIGIIVNFRDISQKFELQESITASNTRYELAARASFDIIWERDFSKNTYTFSEALFNIMGYDPYEVWEVERFHRIVMHPEDRDRIRKFAQKQYDLQKMQFQIPIHRYVRKDGSIAFVDVRCTVIYDKDGKPQKTVGVIRDISDRYAVEEELRLSNERYDLATKASFDIIWDVDRQTKLLSFSDALERLLGYTMKSPMPYEQFIDRVVHPEDKASFLNQLVDFVKSADNLRELPVHRVIKADGAVAYIMVRLLALRGEGGYLTRLIGVSRDITHRYLAEQEMKRSNERYEQMASLNYDVVMEIDFSIGKIYVNNIFKDFYGYDINEFKTPEEAYRALIHPDDYERMVNQIYNNRSSEVLFADYNVFRLRKKDGTVVYCETKSRFIRDENGKPLRSMAIVRNITESYLAEQEIRKSNERYRLAALASYDMLWERDFSTDRYIFSDALSRLFGYDHTMNWTVMMVQEVLFHPEDKQMIRDFLQQCYERKETTFQCPIFRYVKKDGSIAYVQIHCSVVYDEMGNPKRTVGVTRDITGQYLLERKLREANERNELVAKATTDLVWEWNYKTDELKFWNEGVQSLFGYILENNTTQMQWRFDRIHPDDLKVNMAKLKKLIEKGESQLNCQYRFLDAQGKFHHVLDRAYISYDADGNPSRITGAIQDITHIKELEQKIAEEAILHQQQITEVTLLTQEKEREELGRELHDNINQLLAISLMYHSIALTEDPEQSRKMMEKSSEIIKKGVQEIRKLSKRLISPVMDMGLDEAIRDLAEETSAASGIRFSFKKDKFDYPAIPRHLQLMVFRIVQEQLNNILKHAKANKVHLSLAVRKDRLILHINDDGIGFDENKKASGIGLRNMRSRVKLYNGAIHITSQPGKGCKLELTIPVANEEHP